MCVCVCVHCLVASFRRGCAVARRLRMRGSLSGDEAFTRTRLVPLMDLRGFFARAFFVFHGF